MSIKSFDKAKVEIEADEKESQNRIADYLKSKSLVFDSLTFVYSLEKTKVYECLYPLTEDNLYSFDSIKNNLNKDDKCAFRIRNLENTSIFGDILPDLLAKEKERNEIVYKVEYFDYNRFNYIKTHGGEGLEIIDRKSIDTIGKVINFLLKSLGKNFLAGREITNIAMPININDEKTMLETTSYELKSALEFLVPAAEAMKLERVKLITTLMYASLRLGLYCFKPFNPLIGETFQCVIKSDKEEYGELKYYAEQTSHHPPVMNFYAIHDLFKLWGYSEISAIGGANSVHVQVNKVTNILFNDGTHISYKFSDFVINGFLFGTSTLNHTGFSVVTDHTNNLTSYFEVNPKEKSSLVGMIFGMSKEKHFPDYVRGCIAHSTDITFNPKKKSYSVKKEAVLHEVEGEYQTHLNIDGKEYWKSETLKLDKQFKQDFTLPSDSLLRSDMLLFKAGKIELAQYAKMTLEDLQRKDAKLRKNFNHV